MTDPTDSRYYTPELDEVFTQLDADLDNIKVSLKAVYLDVVRVADELGYPPTPAEYHDHGAYSVDTVRTRFGNGSWPEAMTELEFDYCPKAKIRSEQLEADVARVTDKLGHPPEYEDYEEHGEYSVQTVVRRFGDGSWADALGELGYEYTSSRVYRLSEDEVRQDVERVTKQLGHPPSLDEYREHGSYSETPVVSRFGGGSWPAAMRELGYEYPRNQQ
jgi:hypothetical protein